MSSDSGRSKYCLTVCRAWIASNIVIALSSCLSSAINRLFSNKKTTKRPIHILIGGLVNPLQKIWPFHCGASSSTWHLCFLTKCTLKNTFLFIIFNDTTQDFKRQAPCLMLCLSKLTSIYSWLDKIVYLDYDKVKCTCQEG